MLFSYPISYFRNILCLYQVRASRPPPEELKENDLLKKENERKDDIIEKLQRTVEELVSEVKRLNNELHKYKNENSPLHQTNISKAIHRRLRAKGGKRGAPFGHEGTTREQNPDEINDIDTDECPNCHSDDLEDVDVLKRTVEEIPVPVAPKIAEGHIHKKKCRNCGKVFLPPQNETPLKGKFGINLMILILMMKFVLRGALRKTASFLQWGCCRRHHVNYGHTNCSNVTADPNRDQFTITEESKSYATQQIKTQ